MFKGEIQPEIQHKALGMKIEVFDAEGKNIEHTGIAGEMVGRLFQTSLRCQLFRRFVRGLTPRFLCGFGETTLGLNSEKRTTAPTLVPIFLSTRRTF
jgi:hypothetical protein